MTFQVSSPIVESVIITTILYDSKHCIETPILFEDLRKTHYFYIKISKDTLWSRMQKVFEILIWKGDFKECLFLYLVCFRLRHLISVVGEGSRYAFTVLYWYQYFSEKHENYYIAQSFSLMCVESVNIYNFLLGMWLSQALHNLGKNNKIYWRNTEIHKHSNVGRLDYLSWWFHFLSQNLSNFTGFLRHKWKSLPPKGWQKSRSQSHWGVQRVEIWVPMPSILNLADDTKIAFNTLGCALCRKHIFPPQLDE